MKSEASKKATSTVIEQGLRQAARLARSGSTAEAGELLDSLNSRYPDHPDILRLQGINLAQSGRLQEAEAKLARVVELQPGSVMAVNDQASVLLRLGLNEQALQLLLLQESSIGQVERPADRATFWFNLGRAFKQTGQAAEAVQPLLNTLEIQPRHYGALISLGDVYKALGEAAAAAEKFRQAIQTNPADGTAWWSLSNLKADAFTDAEFRQLRQIVPASRRPLAQQAMFEFALASACDQRDLLDEAFAHYQAGNRLAAEREPWDRQQFRRWLAGLQETMTDHAFPGRPVTWQGPRPIFIISMPRSGSTLVEQVLAAHSEVTAASELPWIPQLIAEESTRKQSGLAKWFAGQGDEEWQAMGEKYLQKSQHWSRETPVFTDKLPGNLPYIGAILAMLPEALVVGVRRNAMDVCWSCYRQLLMGGSEFVYDLQSLADYWQDFEAHLDFWEQALPGRVMSVQYEQLVTSPEPEIRRLLEFAGLPFEAACLSPQKAERAVNTASALQVREAIHSRGLGHWQRYARHLQELRQALSVPD